MDRNSLYYYEAQEVSYNSDRFMDFLASLFEYLEKDGQTCVTLVMDNVRFHHVDAVADLIARRGHKTLFLPPYSPMLNPIENLFSQLKHYIKKFNPTTAEEAFAAIELASQVISETDCSNYYNHMATYLSKCLNKERINN